QRVRVDLQVLVHARAKLFGLQGTTDVTIAALAKSSVQGGKAEFVAGCQVPGADIAAFRRNQVATLLASGAIASLIKAQGRFQRTIGVAHGYAKGFHVGIVAVDGIASQTATIPLLCAVGVERIASTELEAGELGALVGDHIVVPNRVGRIKCSTHAVLIAVATKGTGYTGNVQGSHSGLTTQIHTTPGFAAQAQGGLTTKQAILAHLAIAQIKAAFQHEVGFQTATQIFTAHQAPAVTHPALVV